MNEQIFLFDHCDPNIKEQSGEDLKKKQKQTGFNLEHSEKNLFLSNMNPQTKILAQNLYYDKEQKQLVKLTKLETDADGAITGATGELQLHKQVTNYTKEEVEKRLVDYISVNIRIINSKQLQANMMVRLQVNGKLDSELTKVFTSLNQSVGSYKFIFKGKEI